MKLDQIINQPVVETDRFDLRPLRRSDKGLIELYFGDERVARMTKSIAHPLPPGATEAYIARCMSDERAEDIWAIDGTKSGGAEVMGLISLEKLDRDQSEVSFIIAPVYWNTGLASQAVEAMVVNNPLHSATMFATVFQDNPASARVLTHCGFAYLGDAESFSVARDTTVATWTYSRKL
ncbi:MAG: GNAT family N-acetyltransferase [Rhodobacteraceae bacterium]|nr:MAG: GNAT family N-acetyltransferase [Paracoccaceae bacterium]